MEELPIDQILTRARAVLADEVGVAAAVSAMTGAASEFDATLLHVQPAESSGPRLSTSSEGSRWFIWWAWTWTRQC